MTGSAAVYRAYDRNGRLLYIGATTRVKDRLDCHRSQSWWYRLVARFEIESHPTAAAAFAAEAQAIRDEAPAFNRTHTGSYASRPLMDEDVRACRDWIGDELWRVGKLPVSLRWIAEQERAA